MTSNTNQPTELAFETTCRNPGQAPAPNTDIKSIKFFVPGESQPAGSKKAFYRPGMRFPSVVDDCKKSRPWKDTVSLYAESEIRRQFPNGFQLLDGPLAIRIHFKRMRPQGHCGKKGVKPSAPALPTVKPDVLKLARAVEDALTQVAYMDDSQIVAEFLFKSYTTDRPGVEIEIMKINSLEESLDIAKQ